MTAVARWKVIHQWECEGKGEEGRGREEACRGYRGTSFVECNGKVWRIEGALARRERGRGHARRSGGLTGCGGWPGGILCS